MKIIRLEDDQNFIFEKICEWNYHWWGIRNGMSYEELRCNLQHSLNTVRLPQTYVALIGEEPAGMYQLSMSEDLNSRPDLYPWLINVYVDEKIRGKNVCRELMNTVNENAKKANLNELFLYTKHVGLYEKFGWEFVEEVKTFREESPIERLYRLEIK
ncbi:GNAT family N-acetyltransferase [Ureibacillus sp. MALMAid1270]|uniref:GNAT family N-acetyltransferase n=1 Tax=Ureibacillus sp. MALMAid1270 TaxID=3411629 RepID=UPI003BA5D5AE